MDTWHKGCKVTKVSGKYTYVKIPDVLDPQYGCKLLPMGVEAPAKKKDNVLPSESKAQAQPDDEDYVLEDDDDIHEDNVDDDNNLDDSVDEEPAAKPKQSRKRHSKDGEKEKLLTEKALLSLPDEDDLEPKGPKKKKMKEEKVKVVEKTRSKVWDHCVRVVKDGCKYVRCKHCKKMLKTGNSFTTAPAINHLHAMHKVHLGKFSKFEKNKDEGPGNFLFLFFCDKI